MTVFRDFFKLNLALSSSPMQKPARNWFILISIAILVSYAYAFFEWFFFITQPSYTAVSTNLIIKLSVLFFSGLIISAEEKDA